MTGNILQLDFNYKIFVGVPIIVEGTVYTFGCMGSIQLYEINKKGGLP